MKRMKMFKSNPNTYLLFAFTILALCSVMVLGSCGKGDGQTGCENETKHYYLDTDEKEAIPYKGYDTLRFVSNLGDTINCIGNGVHSFTTRDFQMHSDPACGNNGTEKIYEANRFQFIDTLKADSIELSSFCFYPYEPGKGLPLVTIRYRYTTFYIGIWQISDHKVQSYVGDVLVRGVIYSEVNKVKPVGSDTTIFLLLNKVNGIIKMQLTANEVWELI